MYINASCTVVLYLSQVNPMLKDNNKLAKHTGNGKSSMYTYITWKVISGTSVAIYSIVGRGMVTTDRSRARPEPRGACIKGGRLDRSKHRVLCIDLQLYFYDHSLYVKISYIRSGGKAAFSVATLWTFSPQSSPSSSFSFSVSNVYRMLLDLPPPIK